MNRPDGLKFKMDFGRMCVNVWFLIFPSLIYSFLPLDIEMPSYLAIYRVKETVPVSSRTEFYDVPPEDVGTGEYFMSFASDLGELDAPQLGSLMLHVTRRYAVPICKSEDWNVERKQNGTIFLIEGSKYDNIGNDIGDDIKLELKMMESTYRQARENRQFTDLFRNFGPRQRNFNFVILH